MPADPRLLLLLLPVRLPSAIESHHPDCFLAWLWLLSYVKNPCHGRPGDLCLFVIWLLSCPWFQRSRLSTLEVDLHI